MFPPCLAGFFNMVGVKAESRLLMFFGPLIDAIFFFRGLLKLKIFRLERLNYNFDEVYREYILFLIPGVTRVILGSN